MEIHVHYGIKIRPIIFMTSYLCKSPAGHPKFSENGHLKHESN